MFHYNECYLIMIEIRYYTLMIYAQSQKLKCIVDNYAAISSYY